MPTTPPAYKYFAFISYSRKDSKVAAWLQKRLEWFRFPVKLVPEDRRPQDKNFIRPIYRDKTNLEVTDEHYWTNIRAALEQSRFLIVLCSSHSAKSKPVNMEVSHFLAAFGGITSTVVPIIVGGDVVSEGPDAALCPALRDLGTDITERNLPTLVPDADTAERDAWESGFVSLCSYLLKIERTAIGDHIQRESRKQAHTLRLWLGAVIGLALMAITAGWYAWGQKQRAEISEHRTEKALIETQRQLERSKLEEGKGWLERARSGKEARDNFNALMLAGKATGFVDFGRIEGRDDYPLLLSEKFLADPKVEAMRQQARAEVSQFVTTFQPTMMPLWCSALMDVTGTARMKPIWSPDGSRIIGQQEDKVRIWDAATGALLVSCLGHKDSVNDIALSKDGRTIASASTDLTVRLWDAATGRELTQFSGHTKRVNAVVFCQSGTRLASTSDDKTVKLWDLESGLEAASLATQNSQGSSLCSIHDGRHLLVGTRAGEMERWDLSTRQKQATLKISDESVWQITASPDQKHIAARGGWHTLHVMDAESGNSLPHRPKQDYLGSVSFTPDSKQLAICSNESLKLFDLASGEHTDILGRQDDHGFDAVIFRPDGKQVATVGGIDRAVRLWDITTQKQVPNRISGHLSAISRILYSPDGSFIVTRSWDDTIKVWDAATGKESKSLAIQSASSIDSSLALSADGAQVACFASDGVLLWDLLTGKTRILPIPKGEENSLFDSFLGFTASGQTLVAGFQNNPPIFLDIKMGTTRPLFKDDKVGYEQIAISPNGRYLVAAQSESKTLSVWDLKSATQPKTLTGLTGGSLSLEFSTDGMFIIGANTSQQAQVWSLQERERQDEPLSTLIGHTEIQSEVAVSPDGSMAATLEKEADLRLWDVTTGQVIGRVSLGVGEIESMNFSPDGKQLAIGCHHGTIKLLDVSRSSEITSLKDAWQENQPKSWSRDNKLILTSGSSGAALWDATTGSKLISWNQALDQSHPVALSPDGKLVVMADQDGDAQVLEVRTGLKINVLSSGKSHFSALAFSGDGRRMAAGSRDGSIRIWDSNNWSIVHSLDSPGNEVKNVEFSSDGSLLASSINTEEIKLWDAINGRLTFTFPAPNDSLESMALSPDGKSLATSTTDSVIRIWDTSTGQIKHTCVVGHWANDMAFNMDSRLLAYADSSFVSLLDTTTGKTLVQLPNSEFPPAVSFSPDGKYLSAASENNTASIWYLDDLIGPAAHDLLRPQRAGFIHLGEAKVRWQLNDTLYTSRVSQPIHLRTSLLSRLTDPSLTAAQRMVLRLQQAAKHDQWRLAISLWKEAHQAKITNDPALRSAFLIHLAATATTQANPSFKTDTAVFETLLWSALLNTIKTTDLADPMVNLALISAIRQLMLQPHVNQVIFESTLSRLPSLLTPDTATAIAKHLAADADAYGTKPEAKEAGVFFTRKLADAHPASEALQRCAFQTCKPAEAAWQTYLQALLATPQATEEDFSSAAYTASKTPELRTIAKNLVTRSLTKYPNSNRCHRLAGWSYINLSDMPAARAAFAKAISLIEAPEKPGTDELAGLGIVTWTLGDTVAAIETYVQLIHTARSAEKPADYTLPETITQLGWPEAEAKPLEELRKATLAKHPELVKKP